MESILLAAAVLACPVGMGLMMWFMGKGMKGAGKPSPESSADISELRAEQQRLATEVDRLERDGERGGALVGRE